MALVIIAVIPERQVIKQRLKQKPLRVTKSRESSRTTMSPLHFYSEINVLDFQKRI